MVGWLVGCLVGEFKLGDGGGLGAGSAGRGRASRRRRDGRGDGVAGRVAAATGRRLDRERVRVGAAGAARATGTTGRVEHLLSGAFLDALDDLFEALLLALALEQATIRLDLLLERGLHARQLVVVGQQLLLTAAQLLDLGLLLVDQRLAVLLLGQQQLLDLLDARVQLGVSCLYSPTFNN